MICLKCGNEVKQGDMFCANCGCKVMQKTERCYCPSCGEENAADAEFCKMCGMRIGESEITDQQEAVKKRTALSKGKRSRGWKKWTGVLVGVIILITAGFGIYWNFFYEEKSSQEESADIEEEKNQQQVKVQEDEQEMSKYESSTEDDAVNETEEENYSEELEQEVAAQDYILPGSDSRFLKKSDLRGLTAEECRLARNELYARHGRIFEDEALQKYFNSFDWYTPSIQPDDFKESMLNEYEIANRDLIVEYETEQGYR